MSDAGVRHLPIRDNGEIIGLVSMRDLLWVLLAPARHRPGSA
ncbi:MAG TPA: CBS domain-containing protein [Pseudonocardiaceae bacterium]|nr:CBS domain-containing protein [Pseudonocardiaceae bacterium]